MKNGNCIIGLFQGMFAREIQRQLKSKGIAIEPEADESSSGPASFSVVDPDGNPILFDQHA